MSPLVRGFAHCTVRTLESPRISKKARRPSLAGTLLLFLLLCCSNLTVMEGGSQSSQSEHADPDDPVFRQIKEAYDWLKKPRHRHEKGTAREKIAHNLHSAIHTAKGAVARNWNEVAFASSPGPDKKQVALRLILSAYCKSYSNPDDKLEEVRCPLPCDRRRS